MSRLQERLIGTLQDLNARPGYTEREYSLDNFGGDINRASEAAMTDIIALLADRKVVLIRKSDKKMFRVVPSVISNRDAGIDGDIQRDLNISLRAIKKDDFTGELEKTATTINALLDQNYRFGFGVYEVQGNVATRSTTVLDQLRSILSRFDEVAAAYRNQRAEIAQQRAAQEAEDVRAREERRAQRRADAERRDARREARIALEQEERELQAALEAGDQETIERIAQARADRYAAEMDAVAADATAAAQRAENEIDGVAVDGALPADLDRMSFIYGWLAANVDYLYAKLPGWDRHAKHVFVRRYPEAPRTEKAGQPGYSITDADKKTSGGYKWQLANEYHVHFRRGTVQKAPEIVIQYLSSIRSARTGRASIIKGDISSNALAQHLIINLGFSFDRTENSDAYNTCRTRANNRRDFELGYNWSNGAQRAIADAAENPLDQDFPEVRDYDPTVV